MVRALQMHTKALTLWSKQKDLLLAAFYYLLAHISKRHLAVSKLLTDTLEEGVTSTFWHSSVLEQGTQVFMSCV